MRLSGVRRYRRKAFRDLWSDAHDRLTYEIWSGIPFGVFGKERNDIPENSLMPATGDLRSGEMCAQFLRN